MSDPRTELLAITREVARGWLLRGLAKLGSDVTSWKSGSWAHAIVNSAALVIAAASTLVIELVNNSFVDTAKGNWLTLVARWQYGVERGTLSDVELRAMCAVQLTAEVAPADVHETAALEARRADGSHITTRVNVDSTTDGVTTIYAARESTYAVNIPAEDLETIRTAVATRAAPLCHKVIVLAAQEFNNTTPRTLYVDRRRNRPGINDDAVAALHIANDNTQVGVTYDASYWAHAIIEAVPEVVGTNIIGSYGSDASSVRHLSPDLDGVIGFTIELV